MAKISFASVGQASALAALSLAVAAPVMAGEWYFYVQNSSKARLTHLEVKERGGSWGYFEIGDGIAPGEKVRLEWDKSTNSEDCKQSLRASFSDGTSSEPQVFDFCSDLNTPIVFSE